LRGEVIEPQDHGYSEARALYNGMIEKRRRPSWEYGSPVGVEVVDGSSPDAPGSS